MIGPYIKAVKEAARHEELGHSVGWPSSWSGKIGYCRDCKMEVFR